jgi:alkanesulfonate monooxygenase SsuD/methylene tetrahydromethanopterin reductase-like flavin-dependent oxidoreductase (luciferase family)
MARHGMKRIFGWGAAADGAADRVMTAWRNALARLGRETELGTDLAIGYTFHVAETEQKAIKEARPFFEENMKMFAPLGFVHGLTAAQIEAIADPHRARSASLPTLQQAVAAGSWLCGPPERIIEKIQDVQDRYPGLEAINVGSVISIPKKIILEQLEIFAKGVMPVFKNQVTAPVLAP